MKTKILIWIFVAFFTHSLAGSTGLPEFKAINTASKSGISIDKNKWNAGQVNFRILTNSGEVLFSDLISNHEIDRKKFVTDDLQDGNYIIEWKDDMAIVSQEMEIDDSMPVLKSHSYEVLFKPVMNVTNNMLDISVLTLGKTLTFKLYDPEGNLIMKDSSKGQDSYQKRFRIEEIIKGNYILLTNYQGKTVRQYVSMKN